MPANTRTRTYRSNSECFNNKQRSKQQSPKDERRRHSDTIHCTEGPMDLESLTKSELLDQYHDRGRGGGLPLSPSTTKKFGYALTRSSPRLPLTDRSLSMPGITASSGGGTMTNVGANAMGVPLGTVVSIDEGRPKKKSLSNLVSFEDPIDLECVTKNEVFDPVYDGSNNPERDNDDDRRNKGRNDDCSGNFVDLTDQVIKTPAKKQRGSLPPVIEHLASSAATPTMTTAEQRHRPSQSRGDGNDSSTSTAINNPVVVSSGAAADDDDDGLDVDWDDCTYDWDEFHNELSRREMTKQRVSRGRCGSIVVFSVTVCLTVIPIILVVLAFTTFDNDGALSDVFVGNETTASVAVPASEFFVGAMATNSTTMRADATSSLSGRCTTSELSTAEGTRACEALCVSFSSCCRASDDDRRSLSSSCSLVPASLCRTCRRFYNNNATATTSSSSSGFYLPLAAPADLAKTCSPAAITSMEGLGRCEELCAGARCCTSPDVASNCMAEHADVCGAYVSHCPSLGGGGGNVDVGEVCITGREKECFAACAAAACCFPHKFGLGERVCDGGETEEWCDDFQACEILPDVAYGVIAVGDEGPIPSNVTVLAPEEEDETANVNVVASDKMKDDVNLVDAVNSHCVMSQIDTSEGFLACSTLCSKRRCCFDFGPMNCHNARKEWCDEFSLCDNLIEVRSHKDDIYFSNANENMP